MILIAACSSLICLPIVRSSPFSPSSTGFARSLARVAARVVVACRPLPAVSVARSIAFFGHLLEHLVQSSFCGWFSHPS
ncbi:hypothetical protein CSOJ01_14736 [Colletotrichum sojae]|uniref:Secreted protein n=1 Tax=Colletotrichum sojae TaxID=2175907 RepID=A0A8H6IPY3_9PEZI|nr:hypothetical protein CSOJ01_14736 [Colletotrichum sojae]